MRLGTGLSNAFYARNPGVGRINAINGNQDRDDWTYTYDDLDRLLTATNAGDATRTKPSPMTSMTI